jgi:fructose-bisphosphate aldolase / 2-amino-3,7-dideoxy-D-threo-hept-6-ulosonate synthase
MVNGKQVRLARITKGGKMLCIPMDHSFTIGPIAGLENPEEMIAKVSRGGATAFLVHKGIIKSLRSPATIGMIMHISAGTSICPDPSRKVLNSSVVEGLRLGADAISVQVNMGSKAEPEMLEQLGMVADQCDEYEVPLVAMMYPRGEKIKDPSDPEVVAHVARVGAESGADIVKTVYTGDPESFRGVVRKCPVPLVLAGGAKTDSDAEILKLAYDAMQAGAIGVTFGRNVFQHRDPTSIAKALRRVVIEGGSVKEAMGVMKAANA